MGGGGIHVAEGHGHGAGRGIWSGGRHGAEGRGHGADGPCHRQGTVHMPPPLGWARVHGVAQIESIRPAPVPKHYVERSALTLGRLGPSGYL